MYQVMDLMVVRVWKINKMFHYLLSFFKFEK